jgi:hypothetical protein
MVAEGPAFQDGLAGLPMPFLLRFLVQPPCRADAPGGGTIFESPYETGHDNQVVEDYADDEDEDAEIPPQTGLLTDSDPGEDQ